MNDLNASAGSAAEHDAMSVHFGHWTGTGFFGQQSMSSDMDVVIACDGDADAV